MTTPDAIPEDKEPAYPCKCGGNIKEHHEMWSCDTRGRPYGSTVNG